MALQFAVFLLIMTAVVVAGQVYLYRRLVRDTTSGGSPGIRRAGKVGAVLLGLLLVGGRLLHGLWPNAFTQALGDLGYVWMGVAMFLLLALFAAGLVRLAAPAVAAGARVVDEGRRVFLSRAVAGGAVTVAGGMSGYGAWRAYQEPQVSEVVVRLAGLPKALDGMSIVQLTDIHVGNLIERRFMEQLVRQANALRPDLVAVTGDLVDGDVPTLGPAVAALGALRSRYGTYFCNGNHEYYSGDLAWNAFLESLGVTVLRNRHVRVGEASASFDLVGVDDWSMRGRERGYDLDLALQGRDPERAAVLLAHQPANFEQAVERGVGLQLSGHTHGGQLFPFTLLVGLQWKHVAGLYPHRQGNLYVSRGCGFWGPPMRVGSPPEVVKVVLVA